MSDSCCELDKHLTYVGTQWNVRETAMKTNRFEMFNFYSFESNHFHFKIYRRRELEDRYTEF